MTRPGQVRLLRTMFDPGAGQAPLPPAELPSAEGVVRDAPAELLGVSTRTVYSWIQDGRIPSIRLGPKLLRVPTARLLAMGEESESP